MKYFIGLHIDMPVNSLMSRKLWRLCGSIPCKF